MSAATDLVGRLDGWTADAARVVGSKTIDTLVTTAAAMGAGGGKDGAVAQAIVQLAQLAADLAGELDRLKEPGIEALGGTIELFAPLAEGMARIMQLGAEELESSGLASLGLASDGVRTAVRAIDGAAQAGRALADALPRADDIDRLKGRLGEIETTLRKYSAELGGVK